jgi:hypothetical protein
MSAFIVTGYDDEGTVQCGEIVMLLAHDSAEDLFIVCKILNTINVTDIGLLQLADISNGLSCIRLSQLLDVYPLEAYAVGSSRYIAVCHAFSNGN